MTKVDIFIDELASTEVPPTVFNQYGYGNQENKIRRENLRIYLNQMKDIKPNIMLVGEAPGYRGSRLTGVPFTSENLLINNRKGLDLFGKNKGYRLVDRKDKLLSQSTTTIIWETMVANGILPLAWNAFPFHPYKEGNKESNRTPLKKELVMGERPLIKLIELFSIEEVVAVGNKAKSSLDKLGIESRKVRHPAQGGKQEFVKGIVAIKENSSKS